MTKSHSKLSFYISAFAASTLLALTPGCASGGFKLTRQYARWVNSNNIILRIVLYILTAVVFAVTLAIDVVIFNTMDFWNGTVAAGSYEFKDGEKTFQAHHEYLPGTLLRKSTIRAFDKEMKQLQEVVLSETTTGQIEMYVDGKLRTRVDDISSIPQITSLDTRGNITQVHSLFVPEIAIVAQNPNAHSL